MFRLPLIATAFAMAVASFARAGDDVLATLEKAHPRLLLKDARLDELKKQMAGDDFLAKCAKDILRTADNCLNSRPLVHRLIGPRLLDVSRDCLRREYCLCLAYRLTGKDAYAKKAIENMLTVSAFPDWNPSHFLDVAEMTHAVAIGYDWLYAKIDANDRETIRKAIIELGLKPGLKVYAKGNWWVAAEHNWNQVCNGGMIIGSLAIAETDPEYAQKILPAAAASMPKALASYEPDGAWGEGPGYWNYATSYTVYALAALDTALGKDLGLSDRPGLAKTGFFPLYACGPTGLFVNFADSGEKARLHNLPPLFWLAKRYNTPELATAEKDLASRFGCSPLDFVWYYSPAKAAVLAKPLDIQFRGPVELAFLRSAWDDPNALFVSFKAGYNKVNHAHLDLGQFELDALGQRWARDLGSDDYNLPGYFGSKRYDYYRLNSLSHNVPTLDNSSQLVSGRAKMIKFSSSPEVGCAVIDFTSAYAPLASKACRGVAILANRTAVLVQDEFSLIKPCELAWGMTTDAQIAPTKDKAVLKLSGREMLVTVLSPAGAVFTAESAERQSPERPNAGVRRLMIRLKGSSGSVRVAVLFQPVAPGGKLAPAPALRPLADW